MTDRWYGLCPAQLDGIVLADKRPFYFRSRGGWTLSVGEPGWIPNISAWPESHRDHIRCWGKVDIEDPDRIDALVTAILGPWRHVEWEETQFNCVCKCGKTFLSDGSTICMECLIAAFRSDA